MKEIRTCIACRNKTFKKNLLRLTTKNKNIKINSDDNARGYYICFNIECVKKLKNKKKLDKIFKTQISKENFDDIEKYFKK